jgi:hypothetical protein
MLILSSFEILCTWGVIALTLIGIGSIALSLYRKENSLFDTFWMGLAVSVAVLEIWNFVFPVTFSITLLLFCLGILGLVLNSSSLRNGLSAVWLGSRWLPFIGIAFAFLLALRSCGACDHYETGLYGAPAIHWMQTYPVVPGLSNLHGRFGFNSSIFLCIAALGQGVWKELGFHLFTGFLLTAMWFTLLPACARIVRSSATSPAEWFYTIFAIPTFFWTMRSRIVGTQTDEPAAIVCLVATGFLFEYL